MDMSESNIWNVNTWQGLIDIRKDTFMTEDEIEESDYIIPMLNRNVDEMRDEMTTIQKCDIAYNGSQPEEEHRPNTRVNIVHPNIEGQVADMALQDLGFNVQGQDYSDDQFADMARNDIEWTMAHQNNSVGTLSKFIRRFLKYGWAFFKPVFNMDKFDGFGLAEIQTPAIDRVLVDRKITNYLELQKSEYIAEVIRSSRMEVMATYGEDKANCITYGTQSILNIDRIVDVTDYSTDEISGCEIIQFWSKHDGLLRCREYSTELVLLWDSFKGQDKKENQKHNKVVPTSVYTQVDNNYPYMLSICYEEEGKLFGFGDVKLLLNIQDAINSLYDNMRIANRPKKVFIDDRAGVDPDEIDEDVFAAQLYDGEKLRGADPTHEVDYGTSNPAWERMIAYFKNDVQNIIRYSDLMKGQGGSSNTATESAIQERQGSKATSMKQRLIENAIKEAVLYCFGLDLQFRKGKKAMRVIAGDSEMQWVDYDVMKAVPQMNPMEQGERKKWVDAGNDPLQIPDSQILTENGAAKTKRIAIDLKVVMGAKAPQTPQMISNAIVQFANLQLLTEDGKPRPLIYWDEFRKFAIETLGMPLDDPMIVNRRIKAYEEEQKRIMEEQRQLEMDKAKAEQQGNGLPTPLPNGSPPTVQEDPLRRQLGVMEGQADFNKIA